MKKFNTDKSIIIVLIVAIIAVTAISISAAKRANEGKPNIVQSVANDGVAAVDKVLFTPARWIKSGVDSVNDLFTTYSENERLKEKVDGYDELSRQTTNQQKEIEQLKEELALNQTLGSYEKVPATVITRSPDTWQDMLIVDKGENDGIEANMAVVSQKGLIGRVIEVNKASSKVELLTSENRTANQFPVKVASENGESFGVLKSFDSKNQWLVVSEVTGNQDIKEGDIVQTSGLGGNSPANLPLGTVAKVKPDQFGLDREIYVTPYAQMYDLSYVTIIKRLAEVSE